eukprot:999843-Prymnesium_polylepis.1
MHRHARDLVGVTATQYAHPWQHGTGHTKATALFLRNLPPLKPTCLVDGREHAMARLPPTPDRSATAVSVAAPTPALPPRWLSSQGLCFNVGTPLEHP